MKMLLDAEMVKRLLGHGPTRRARFDLLVYWGRHPGGWSTRRAIAPQTRLPREDIDRALAELVQEGIVEVHQDPSGPYFSLTTDPQLLGAVTQLGHLTPRERQALLHGSPPGRDGQRSKRADHESQAGLAK